ncbi:MAG TPA: metalloregulator ArsR/SmtB family transcription factor [Jiangellaceae bacterium]
MTMNEGAQLSVEQVDEAEAATAAACLFRGMGDPSRVAILQHLLLGEHNVGELTSHLGLAQSTVSKHLACLRDCGLVESRPVGRSSVFSLTHPDAVRKVFAAAEELLAATGDAVVLCPVYGEGATT